MEKLKFVSLVLILCNALAFVSANKIEKRQGDFVLHVSLDGGSFSLAYAPENSRNRTDFFVSHDDYATTYFSLLLDDAVYRLRRDSVSSMRSTESDLGAGLVYRVKDKLNVSMNLSFLPQFSGVEQGLVKIEVELENISSSAVNVGLKGVFDTLLGENSGIHFVTARYPYVSTEETFTEMALLQWVRSTNGNESIQFLFDGNGISSPRLVALANKDVVTADGWIPNTKAGRTFNSVFSYNNSAVCALWNTMSLTPATKSSVTFYIALAAKSKVPPSAQFLGKKEGTGTSTDGDEIVYTDEDGVVYTVGDITDSMLNMRYINDLLDRIRRLEEDPENIDRNELLRLNGELDAILEKVRRL